MLDAFDFLGNETTSRSFFSFTAEFIFYLSDNTALFREGLR